MKHHTAIIISSELRNHTNRKIHCGTDLGKTNVSHSVQPEVEVVRVLEMEPFRLKKKNNKPSLKLPGHAENFGTKNAIERYM